MVYSEDFSAAGLRHLTDAEHLYIADAFDTAGYHYGFTAECAIKTVIGQVTNQTRKHIAIDHSRDLRPTAIRILNGRIGGPMLTVLRMKDYFKDWDVTMRYSASGTVTKAVCDQWRKDAIRTAAAAGIRRK